MYSVLMKIGQNRPKSTENWKLLPWQNFTPEGYRCIENDKKSQFSAKVLRFLAVLTGKNHQKWAKSDLTLAKRNTHEQKGCHGKTIEQLKIIFSPKDVPFNLTKSHQVSVASVDYCLEIADEKREGDKKPLPPPPSEDRVNKCSTVSTTFTENRTWKVLLATFAAAWFTLATSTFN